MNIIKKNFNKKVLVSLLFFIAYSFLLTFTIEAITRGEFVQAKDFVRHFFSKFAFNTFIVALTLSPCFLFKRRLFVFTLITSIWIIFSIGDNLVLQLRGAPLTGADLGMIKNGLELSNQYLTSSSLILMIIALIVLIVALIVIFIKSPKVKMSYTLNIISLVLLILISPRITDYAMEKKVVSKNFWDITAKYKEYGFAFSFLNSIVNTGIDKPQGYSDSLVEKTKNEINLYSTGEETVDEDTTDSTVVNTSNTSVTPKTPNIIIVQLESFIDQSMLKDFTFNKEVTPNFQYLIDNYSSGFLEVPSIGGGTANTEFEVITGLSSSLFGAGEFPYNTLLSSKTSPSLASYLKDYNYDADAMHNHEGTFYCRNKVYKNLGFDSFASLEVMGCNNNVTPLGWAKDTLLLPEIKLSLEKSENPALVFAVSVQGHGGYPSDKEDTTEFEITSDYNEENKSRLEYYLQQIHEMDMFIGELLELVEATNEPTAVILYGDHLPAVGLSNDDLITGNQKQTSYVIWDNFGLEEKDEDLKAYELSSKILSDLSFPLTTLAKLHRSTMPTDEKLENLKILEYDMLYGKNYTSDYTKAIPSDNFKYGLRDFIIDNVVINSDYIEITGKNFNTFSRVFINDNIVDTEYVNENTLRVKTTDINSGDSIIVKQTSYSKSTIFVTSNEYILK